MPNVLAGITSFLTGLPAIVTAALSLTSFAAAAMTVLTQWRAVQAQSNARLLSIDDRKKLVAFWVEWLDAQAKALEGDALAAAKLVASQNLDLLAQTATRQARAQQPAAQASLAQILLLEDPGRGRRAIAILGRSPFYAAVLLLGVFALLGAQDLVAHFRVTSLMIYVLGVAILAIIAVGIRAAHRPKALQVETQGAAMDSPLDTAERIA